MTIEEQPAIRLSGVELSRPHFRLGPMNLEVPRGFVTAIVGPNGSGKSTTFRMLLDIVKPDRGEIEVLGSRIGGGKQTELLQRIGYLPEGANSAEDAIKASEKTAFHSEWYPTWDVNLYRDLLRLFEIEPNLKLGKMSKGMRRRYELAIAMSHHPDLLLLDEPSSGLDPLAWRSMIDLLHRYMERGDRTILIATHIVEEVKRLADYIVFMVHGKVLGMYEKDELMTGWRQYYFTGTYGELSGKLSGMPGLNGLEDAGGVVRAVTSKAAEAEDWLLTAGLTPAGRQSLELDDILAAVVERERLQGQRAISR